MKEKIEINFDEFQIVKKSSYKKLANEDSELWIVLDNGSIVFESTEAECHEFIRALKMIVKKFC